MIRMQVGIVFSILLVVFCSFACSSGDTAGATGERSVSGEPLEKGFEACEAKRGAGSSRRALVIGINDYSASTLSPPETLSSPATRAEPAPGRSWRNLRGAVNDARAMCEVLADRFGFDVRLLLDQEATREAILGEIRSHLVEPAKKGDELVFVYAGHGSQVRNSASEELDKLDESLVPADARVGAKDVRDKEIRRLFNKALEKKAQVTLILDNCHSGSGARSPYEAERVRELAADTRDLAEPEDPGSRLEDRGALILSAAQNDQKALEVWDGERRRFHGAFTLSLLHSLRVAADGASGKEIYQRSRAWLKGPFAMSQEPVLAGEEGSQGRPFLGAGELQEDDAQSFRVAVEEITGPEDVLLQGGWIHGLEVGSELVSSGRELRKSRSGSRFRVSWG